jgi:hypothetical protein
MARIRKKTEATATAKPGTKMQVEVGAVGHCGAGEAQAGESRDWVSRG